MSEKTEDIVISIILIAGVSAIIAGVSHLIKRLIQWML